MIAYTGINLVHIHIAATKKLFAWGDPSRCRLGQLTDVVKKTERNSLDPDAPEQDMEFKLSLYDITKPLQDKKPVKSNVLTT